jgi:hypothetical protein
MKKRMILSVTALAGLAALSGCSNSRNDTAYEREGFDDVGETRVFDAPGHVASSHSRTNGISESVPAPAPIAQTAPSVSRQSKDVAKKVEKAVHKSSKSVVASARPTHSSIGELDMEQ